MRTKTVKRNKVAVVARAGSAREQREAPPSATHASDSSKVVATDTTTPTLSQRGLPDDTTSPKRTASEAMKAYWAEVRAGTRPDPRGKQFVPRKAENPLLDLPEEQRSKLFAWLRECPYDDAVQVMLRDQGLPDITRAQLDNFFQLEAEDHWEKRISRAAEEANALVRLVEKSPAKYSAGILAALGQEVFRQIASGQVEPDAMGKLAALFLKARSDERVDQMQELKREKLRHELGDQLDQALEQLAKEVDRNPTARDAFDALKRELAEYAEENK